MTNNKASASVRHYLIVVVGCLIMMGGTGIIFSVLGIFVPVVTAEFGIGKGTFSLWLTIALLTAFVSMPVAGKLFAKRSARLLITIGGVLAGLSQVLFSLATSVWLFYILAVPIGIGMSILGYVAVPTLLNRWFKKRVGFFTGICMAFTGVGGVIFNQVGGALIASSGWRAAYVVMGICTMVLIIPLTLLVVRDYPSDVGLEPYGAEGDDATQGAAKKAAVSGVTLAVAQKTSAFALLMVFVGLMSFGSSIYQYLASYLLTLPVGQANVGIGATLGSIVMFSQALGKIGLGYIGDKNTQGSILLSVGCAVVSLLLFWFLPTSTATVYVAGFLFGIYYATTLVLAPIMCRKLFGVRDFSVIYSRFSMVIALLAACSVSILGFVVDATGSFTALWVIGLAVGIVSLVAGLYALKLGEKNKWAERVES